MFTGIIDSCGQIKAIAAIPEGKRFQIHGQYTDLKVGESIAVNGICLTVAAIDQLDFYLELSPETLAKTNSNSLKIGDKVNLERALKLSDRLGGHFVTGHVDTTTKLIAKEKQGDFLKMIFAIKTNAQRFLIDKGSIAINGVSLTINQVLENAIELMLIPHTLAVTNLNELKLQAEVNVEFDLLAKLVNKQLQVGAMV